MYTLFCGNWSKQFSSWWELIGYIKQHDYDKRYAHNPNDCIKYKDLYTFRILDNDCYQFKISSAPRDCIAYCDDTVINLAEIRDGIENFIERAVSYKSRPRSWNYKKVYFEYRREPVPGIGHSKSKRWKIPRHSYRSSWIKAFDGQYPKAKNHLSSDPWWDDEYPRRPEKNWKSQGKKKHQWEKK